LDVSLHQSPRFHCFCAAFELDVDQGDPDDKFFMVRIARSKVISADHAHLQEWALLRPRIVAPYSTLTEEWAVGYPHAMVLTKGPAGMLRRPVFGSALAPQPDSSPSPASCKHWHRLYAGVCSRA
jgi:hypothetical protein